MRRSKDYEIYFQAENRSSSGGIYLGHSICPGTSIDGVRSHSKKYINEEKAVVFVQVGLRSLFVDPKKLVRR